MLRVMKLAIPKTLTLAPLPVAKLKRIRLLKEMVGEKKLSS